MLKRKAPAPLNLPKIAHFIFERGLTMRAAAEQLGRSRQWVQLICLPFDDPRRRIPDVEDMERIHAWSGGELTPADFYPPALSGKSDLSAEPSAAS